MPLQDTTKPVAPPPPVAIPPDIYQVQLVDINEGKNTFSGEPQLEWDWAILDEGSFKDAKGRQLPFRNHRLRGWTSLTWFHNPKTGRMSNLFSLACAFTGKQLSNEDGTNFKLNDFIGKQVRITIQNAEKNGIMRNKIIGYMPIKKELKGLADAELKPAE